MSQGRPSCYHGRPVDQPDVSIARLGREGGDPAGLESLRAAFLGRNPGYGLDHRDRLDGLAARSSPCAAFVHAGAGRGAVGEARSELGVGDLVLLRPGQELAAEGPLGGVVFTLPDELPAGLPSFVRPDWDPRITDTPGGCAEEAGAYRRILLTWLGSVGPYVYRGLNAHRVRMTDSFSHYHPGEGGFDEFYLVQGLAPGARLVTSTAVERIEAPASVAPDEVGELVRVHELEVGDLVHVPRGVVHRGVGGVLAQVITVPGFKPGCEIGVDHHLFAINERLGLSGTGALPYHAAAARKAVVK